MIKNGRITQRHATWVAPKSTAITEIQIILVCDDDRAESESLQFLFWLLPSVHQHCRLPLSHGRLECPFWLVNRQRYSHWLHTNRCAVRGITGKKANPPAIKTQLHLTHQRLRYRFRFAHLHPKRVVFHNHENNPRLLHRNVHRHHPDCDCGNIAKVNYRCHWSFHPNILLCRNYLCILVLLYLGRSATCS